MHVSRDAKGRSRTVPLLILLIAIAIFVWIALRIYNREAFVDREPPGDETPSQEFAGSQPKQAFHLEEGNLLTRTVFSAAAPANSQVEVRDYKFPIHAKTHLGALPGPGVLEVYSGHGSLSLNGKSEELSSGVIKQLPGGQALDFDNQGDYSLVVRLYLVEGK